MKSGDLGEDAAVVNAEETLSASGILDESKNSSTIGLTRACREARKSANEGVSPGRTRRVPLEIRQNCE